MGETTIEWTQRPGTVGRTWNVCRGCRRKSTGCERCYAERIAGRFSGKGQPYEGLVTIRPRKDGGTRHGASGAQVLGSKAVWNGEVAFVIDKLLDPLRWREPATCFANSMSDMFYDEFTNEQIAAQFGVMYLATKTTFQILTKRAKRMREWHGWINKIAADRGIPEALTCVTFLRELVRTHLDDAYSLQLVDRAIAHANLHQQLPLPNVWLGVSVENNDHRDRIDELLMTPAVIRMLSIEPMLGPVDLMPYLDPTGVCDCSYENGQHCKPRCAKDAPWRHTAVADVMIDPVTLDYVRHATADEVKAGMSVHLGHDPTINWVIIGCESGPGMRTCDTRWIRDLVEQCKSHNVPVFLKQAREDKEIDVRSTRSRLGIRKGKKSGTKGSHGGVITLPYLDGVQYAEFPA